MILYVDWVVVSFSCLKIKTLVWGREETLLLAATKDAKDNDLDSHIVVIVT